MSGYRGWRIERAEFRELESLRVKASLTIKSIIIRRPTVGIWQLALLLQLVQVDYMSRKLLCLAVTLSTARPARTGVRRHFLRNI